MLLSSIFVFAIAIQLSTQQIDVSTSNYRAGGYDGAIAAYLFLKGENESNIKLEDVLQDLEGSDVSMKRLSDFICANGIDCETVKCAPAQLRQLKHPAIVLLDNLMGDGSCFAVILPHENPTFYLILLGDSASIVQVSPDDFRRSWTGYAIVKCPSASKNVSTLTLTFCLIGFVLGSFASRRSGKAQ